MFADVGITGVFTSQGTVFDNTHQSTAFFGVLCNYTSTRSDKFYFDDLTITGDPYVDNELPVVSDITVSSSTSLQVHFNEEINSVTANTASNYSLDNEVGSPLTAKLQPDKKMVLLSFSKSFINGVNHILEIWHVADINGNAIILLSSNFLYFSAIPAKAKDIIISEIFANPSPQLGLPDAEYIEIYNQSNYPFDLAGWKLSNGNSTGTFATIIVLPKNYYVITANTNISKFGNNAHLIGLSNFPTLNNAGDMLQLMTADGLVIDSVNYDLNWYRDGDKEEEAGLWN